jgi:PadR family transcriptional regulator AphA
MPPKTKTAFAVLGFLSIAPMSGYQMRQLMQKSTAHFWSESDGQLYPMLAKLATHKLITAETSETDRREKKIYTITALGKVELNNWLMQAAETNSVRNEFMLKLFFSGNVLPDITLAHVQAYRYKTKTLLTQLNETLEQLEHDKENSNHLPYWLFSVEYGKQMAEAKLTWCDKVISTLKKINEEC